jgi:hypothetical protein
MIFFRIYIEDKKVINKVYWKDSPDDTGFKALEDQIEAVFPNENLPYDNLAIGVDVGDSNVLTIHQCSVEQDSALAARVQNDLLIDKDFIRYIYDLENATKSYEIFYKNNQEYSVQPLGAGLSIYRISDMLDSDFNKIGLQGVYVRGSNADIFTWAETLKPGISMPITVGRQLNDDDSFKFEFNTATKELVSVKLFARPERTMVWNKEGTDTYIEYTADYTHDLINPEDAELVIPKYDVRGNRVASDTVIEDINEYILVPKPGFDGEFEKVKLSEI